MPSSRRNNKSSKRDQQSSDDEEEDDCCCFAQNSTTQLFVTAFVLFFLAVCGGIAAAALGSQRCCGSAWTNEDHVSLACSAVYRSCYDVTRAALGVGMSAVSLMLIGFIMLGIACHCQHQRRMDKKAQRREANKKYEFKTEQKRLRKQEAAADHQEIEMRGAVTPPSRSARGLLNPAIPPPTYQQQPYVQHGGPPPAPMYTPRGVNLRGPPPPPPPEHQTSYQYSSQQVGYNPSAEHQHQHHTIPAPQLVVQRSPRGEQVVHQMRSPRYTPAEHHGSSYPVVQETIRSQRVVPVGHHQPRSGRSMTPPVSSRGRHQVVYGAPQFGGGPQIVPSAPGAGYH
ncbi:unnamed protein product [Amoebophrya sp. A120]|nr:unnamed protein product [Amoebophrya sp. A120]|eukprot:GSA120T00024514001.1